MSYILFVIVFVEIFCESYKSNWAVVVDASNFWYNVRHEVNALYFYRTLKSNGFPDSHIVLMISDDFICNSRNPDQGKLYYASDRVDELCKENIEIDYKGYEVSEENLLRVLTHNHLEGTPEFKKIQSDNFSNVVVYLTGHGGDNFLKFRDKSAISGGDLANAIDVMESKNLYRNLMLIADTCEAASLSIPMTAHRFLSLSSSAVGEHSYATHFDRRYGLSMIDQFTLHLCDYIRQGYAYGSTVADYFHLLAREYKSATPVLRMDLFPFPPHLVFMRDFFYFKGEIMEVKKSKDFVEFHNKRKKELKNGLDNEG
jgi:phosphatidylinositol glycan class K